MPTADELLGRRVVENLAVCLKIPSLTPFAKKLNGLSLSERARAVRDILLHELPVDYGPAIDTALDDPEFTGWMIWPVSETVAVRATSGGKREFDSGLAILARLTPLFTGEFAIRTFLDADLDRTLATALKWTKNKDPHVRRLATEGTRPFLPWARRVPALTARPEATIAILDALHRDESEYVRRSVANHLNDLSRTAPELVVETATRWSQNADTRKLVRHALRTLVKKGNPDALALLGFAAPAGIELSDMSVSPRAVSMGESIAIEFALSNTGKKPISLAVDYIVHHVKANGGRTPKVFKLTTRTLQPGERVVIEKVHSFKPITTRVYYSGEHALDIQVNGTVLGSGTFSLTV